MEFVKFVDISNSHFLDLVKENAQINDKKISEILGVSKSLVWRYKKGLNPIRKDFFFKLCISGQIKPSSFNYSLFVSRNHNNHVEIPELTSYLAEFIGIILGDGHMSKQGYGIIVTCGLIDLPYIINYVPFLGEYLFKKDFSLRFVKDRDFVPQVLIYSKEVFNYLVENYGLEIGKKRYPKIPKAFFTNINLLKSCLRGLFDTDGGLYSHHSNSLQICFYNSSLSLIFSVREALLFLGYNVYFYWDWKREKGTLSLTGDDARLFLYDIGFNNTKNLVKWYFYLLYGFVPKNEVVLPYVFNRFLLNSCLVNRNS